MALLAITGCAPNQDANEADTGVVRSSLTSTPLDVRCLQLTAVQGASTSVKKVAVGPQAPAAFTATGLPIGAVTVSLQAFTQSCTSVVATTTAKWISDPQMLTLAGGVPADVTFKLRLATTGAVVDVRSDFPDPRGSFTRLVSFSAMSVPNMILGPRP